MKFIGIIPARYASTRFPGKPLAIINGKSMIQRVYEQVYKSNIFSTTSKNESKIIVATEDISIENHVKNFNGNVMMTSSKHKTGTERCFEVVEKLQENYDVVINIQGDEPYIDPTQIEKLGSCFTNKNIQLATLLKIITDKDELFDINVVKAVVNNKKEAVYFSRNPIPFFRGKDKEKWLSFHDYYKHIGIYGYRTDVLKKIVKFKPTPLETAESLEQLRWLENALKINIEFTEIDSFSIDTYDDLVKVKKIK